MRLERAPIPASWPAMPALVQPPQPIWAPTTSLLSAGDAGRVEAAVGAALVMGDPPAITITRSLDEIERLLAGAPRLRTTHDRPADSPPQIRKQMDMRVRMEQDKGTFHGGITAYGAVRLLAPGAPGPVLDPFGDVALTLASAALERATFLPTDSMMTAQRPATRSQLASVYTERLMRDAGLVEAPEMNDERFSNSRRDEIASTLTTIATADAATGARLAAGLLQAPDFATGMRYIEAQVPAVTLTDVARIDISPNVEATKRAHLVELATSRGIPVAVAI